MTKRKVKLLSCACFILLGGYLSGCSTMKSDGMPPAKMTFNHLTPQPLYVAAYGFADESGEVASPSQKNKRFVDNPARVIKDYFGNRFVQAGSTGKLRVALDSLTVGHYSLESDTVVGELLGLGRNDLYTVKAEISLQMWGNAEKKDMGTHFIVTRDMRIPESYSVADRQNKQMEMLDHLINDIDMTVEKILREDFSILK